MGERDRDLPPLGEEAFRDELQRCAAGAGQLPERLFPPLYQHYQELRRWNRRLSLVGPGTVREVLSRHYAESLTALPLLEEICAPTSPTSPDAPPRLVDLGSGAGFPGFVLAAARPDLEVTLVESRERKWAFLRSAVRRSGLSCRCLNARVRVPLPDGFPSKVLVVTSRALAVGPEVLAEIHRSSPVARFLLWQGEAPPRLPETLVADREVPLPGSERRRILEIRGIEPP